MAKTDWNLDQAQLRNDQASIRSLGERLRFVAPGLGVIQLGERAGVEEISGRLSLVAFRDEIRVKRTRNIR